MKPSVAQLACLLLVVSCLAGESSAGIPLPLDGESAWRDVIEDVMPETADPGTVVNLSEASVLAGYNAGCRVAGDSLVCLHTPWRRDWLMLDGECARMVASSDRSSIRSYRAGIPCLSDALTGGSRTVDTADLKIRGMQPRSLVCEAELDQRESCGFIFCTGDTVKSTMRVCLVVKDLDPPARPQQRQPYGGGTPKGAASR